MFVTVSSRLVGLEVRVYRFARRLGNVTSSKNVWREKVDGLLLTYLLPTWIYLDERTTESLLKIQCRIKAALRHTTATG